MALILNIDTATEHALVALTDEKGVIASEHNDDPMSHAAFVQPAIESMVTRTGVRLQQIDAVAVSAGPGSYTGLRVGLASAKGLCFALDKPLILLNTLCIMAQQAKGQIGNDQALYCPMIDARRMEVFAALFDFSLNEIIPTGAFILTEESFTSSLTRQQKPVVYFGSGALKWEKIAPAHDAIFIRDTLCSAYAINQLAQDDFKRKAFADVAYSEPLYAKNFFTTAKIIDHP